MNDQKIIVSSHSFVAGARGDESGCWHQENADERGRGVRCGVYRQGHLSAQLPFTVLEDVNGHIWQLRQRRYGSSWYQPGDSQPHGERDIALPATILRGGQPWSDDE